MAITNLKCANIFSLFTLKKIKAFYLALVFGGNVIEWLLIIQRTGATMSLFA